MLLPLRRVGLWWLFAHCTASDDEDPFQVHLMLRSAVGRIEQESVEEACVPADLAAQWKSGFQAAVDTMLQKTKRSMQMGLSSMAEGVMTLVDGNTCGELEAFGRLKGQAERLKVLASTRSLAGLDAKVQYEPLKALTVGGIDVHLELNALLVAWQMKRGPEEVGSALSKFLADFSEDDDSASSSGDTAPQGDVPEKIQHAPGALQRTPAFWAAVLNQAFSRLRDSSHSVEESCLTEAAVRHHGTRLDEAFGRMMQKTQRSMQAGLKVLASDTLVLLQELEAGSCHKSVKASSGLKRLRAAASRLETLVGTRSLVNPGTNVKYEALQSLHVAGVDVHVELNKLIASWINDKGATDVGEALADFFEDFREQKEDLEDGDKPHPLTSMLQDAVTAAADEASRLPETCFSKDGPALFAEETEAAIEQMLKKRRKTMQQGLKELADAVHKVFSAMPADCLTRSGAKAVLSGASKLKKLTRRTLVDYGTYIKYEALKSLEVGGVAVHAELNAFLSAWKLRGRLEAGAPLGTLFKRLSGISGHDEF